MRVSSAAPVRAPTLLACVVAMGQEPWLRFVAGLQYTPQSKQIVESDKFIGRCREAGLTAERLYGSRTMRI